MRDAASGRWLRFTQLREVVTARTLADVAPGLRRVEQAVLKDGHYAAGFISYEAAPAFEDSLVVNDDGHFPLLWFGLYAGVEEVELPAVSGLSDAAGAPTSSRLCVAGNPATPLGLADALSRLEVGAPDWQPSVEREEFDEAMARIKALIRGGDTYQVNYTYRLTAKLTGDPWNLFLRMVAPQDPPYGAFLDTGEWVICSASPELFFRLEGTRIECRPMKGTAARGRTPAEDLAQAQALQASEKERAENVMIVDMVRHDLGRVAQTGSVKVARLFEVERYPTIWQMTSTVEAQTEAGLCEIFQALFPAASVTGAPKVRTMQVIADLEPLPRRLYTGAIGFFAPGQRAQFNVAIRTLLVNRNTGCAEYGVGSGITWDSNPEAEWQECRSKARILYLASTQTTGRPDPQHARDREVALAGSLHVPEASVAAASRGRLALRPNRPASLPPQPSAFSLLETMRWTPEEGYYLLERHLERLQDSAFYFGFRLDLAALRLQLEQLCARLGPKPRRIRLLASQDGRIRLETKALRKATVKPQRIALARAPVDSANPFLYRKTTNRKVYDAAKAACHGFDDVLLFNEQGELTESTIANVAVDIAGKLCTPPVTCGLLPGTMRAHLIQKGELNECPITVIKLLRSTRVFLFNSVRGMYPVEVVKGHDA
jgi:para-aminobenzoate synthetase / 4-amino-4-deoxychorismate lyase